MSSLYDLLPAVYRQRDADQAYALRGLLDVVDEQSALLHADVQQLWDDFFIETCRRWVIPYIGDLVSNRLLSDPARSDAPDTASTLFTDLRARDLRPRAATPLRKDVARTIWYRRRKGTRAVVEQLARDVTDWSAHAVEFFRLLGWTQSLVDPQPRVGWVDVRSPTLVDEVDGPFDASSHTVDVRPTAPGQGRYAVPNLGLFLWRLGSYPLEGVPAPAGDHAWRRTFSPLGNSAPIFLRRRDPQEGRQVSETAVPAPLRLDLLYRDLLGLPPAAATSELYGSFETEQTSFAIVADGVPVPAAEIRCSRLSPWPAHPPHGRVVAVDSSSGRIALGTGYAGTDNLDVSYHYGFPADLGGGPYDRAGWLVDPALPDFAWTVLAAAPAGAPNTYATVADALAAADAEFSAAVAAGGSLPFIVVTIEDNGTYDLPPEVTLPRGARLVVQAADGVRPLLRTREAGRASLRVATSDAGPPDALPELTLSGVLVQGWLWVVGDLGRLRLLHATLVPGRQLDENGAPVDATDPSVHVVGSHEVPADGTTKAHVVPLNRELQLEIAFSIVGPLLVPAATRGVTILDSIVDGLDGRAIRGAERAPDPDPAAPLSIERSTVLGSTQTRRLDASDCVFAGPVIVERRQAGCVRFSYVRPDAQTPRRYRCQPDLAGDEAVETALRDDPHLPPAAQQALRAAVAATVVPSFAARRYGDPAYGRLGQHCPAAILTGGENGSEMGVLNHLDEAQRESNLTLRLREYMPFGLVAGTVYVT